KATDRGIRLGTTWGAAVCELGLGVPAAAESFQSVTDLIDPASPRHAQLRYDLQALRETVPEGVFVRGGQVTPWAKVIDAWPAPPIGEEERYRLNLDLLRILITIDQWEAASRLLVREIKHVRTLLRLPSREQMERDYLLLLAATMEQNAFRALGWVRNESGVFVRRSAAGNAEFVNDFAPFFDPKVEDARTQGTGLARYGMLDAEEDRATCIEIYSRPLRL